MYVSLSDSCTDTHLVVPPSTPQELFYHSVFYIPLCMIILKVSKLKKVDW